MMPSTLERSLAGASSAGVASRPGTGTRSAHDAQSLNSAMREPSWNTSSSSSSMPGLVAARPLAGSSSSAAAGAGSVPFLPGSISAASLWTPEEASVVRILHALLDTNLFKAGLFWDVDFLDIVISHLRNVAPAIADAALQARQAIFDTGGPDARSVMGDAYWAARSLFSDAESGKVISSRTACVLASISCQRACTTT